MGWPMSGTAKCNTDKSIPWAVLGGAPTACVWLSPPGPIFMPGNVWSSLSLYPSNGNPHIAKSSHPSHSVCSRQIDYWMGPHTRWLTKHTVGLLPDPRVTEKSCYVDFAGCKCLQLKVAKETSFGILIVAFVLFITNWRNHNRPALLDFSQTIDGQIFIKMQWLNWNRRSFGLDNSTCHEIVSRQSLHQVKTRQL